MTVSAKKSKNPLYVVTNDGKDVETATNLFDMLVKKLGLAPVIEIFKNMIEHLTHMTGNYGVFLFLQELIDNFVTTLESIISQIKMFIPSSLNN